MDLCSGDPVGFCIKHGVEVRQSLSIWSPQGTQQLKGRSKSCGNIRARDSNAGDLFINYLSYLDTGKLF